MLQPHFQNYYPCKFYGEFPESIFLWYDFLLVLQILFFLQLVACNFVWSTSGHNSIWSMKAATLDQVNLSRMLNQIRYSSKLDLRWCDFIKYIHTYELPWSGFSPFQWRRATLRSHPFFLLPIPTFSWVFYWRFVEFTRSCVAALTVSEDHRPVFYTYLSVIQ